VKASAYTEKFNYQLCDFIYTSLDQSFGRAPLERQDFMKDFWTDDMNRVFDLKERYYQKWRKATGLNCLRFWLLHQQTRAQLLRLIHQRKRALWRQFCDNLSQGSYAKSISKFSKTYKRLVLKPSFSAPGGPQQAADQMANHLQATYSGRLLSSLATTTAPQNNTPLPFSLDQCPIMLDLIENTIHSLPPRKAPGVDHLKKEMLFPILDDLLPLLYTLFRLCWT
ncbi:hypothetical protein BD560DRAFT_343195, partial [Blakeslea trispora]